MADEITEPDAEAVTPGGHHVRLLIFGDRGIGTDLLLEGFEAASVTVDVLVFPDTPTYLEARDEGDPTSPPGLILIDLDRHGESAGPAIERLREGTHRKAPILVFSDLDEPDIVDETYRQGASAYLVKPTDPQEYRDYAFTIAAFWFGMVTMPRPEPSHANPRSTNE